MKLLLALTLLATPVLAQTRWDQMDLGPFHSGTFHVDKEATAKGIAIKVGTPDDKATVLFDTELLRVSAAWTGGFVKIPAGRGGLEGQLTPAGDVKFKTTYATGWAKGDIINDPRDKHQGHLSADQAKWRGLYLNGDKVILSYSVGLGGVLELDGFETRGAAKVFTRTFEVGVNANANSLLICEAPGQGSVEGNVAKRFEAENVTLAGVVGAPEGSKMVTGDGGRISLKLPALTKTATFQVVVWSGKNDALPAGTDWLKSEPLPSLAALCKGGAPQWNVPIETAGILGTGDDAYVADEITLPVDNPFKSWLRPGGHDFLPDGTAVLVNISGDVWLVSGLDEKLEHVKWKRFATGLFQPLGCKVVDGKIYVTCRDQITRLTDLNGDGEADFYECFNNDCVVADNYHEFALDLQTDSKGNFFYGKGSPWTPTNMTPDQGTIIKVSGDGSKLEVFATGVRAPNGLGMGPKDELTFSDNQGHWMPANRLNLVKEGGFYGMTPAAHKTLTMKLADGTEITANPSDAEARAKYKTDFWGKADSPIPSSGYDVPLCWVPMEIDNSSGGQVWVPPGAKWGPLGGRMLFMSYGKCSLFNVLQETVNGLPQGGLCRFPLNFKSGIMRGRFSPKDGQLYVSGLNVWQSSASKDGCFYRVRYTGKPTTVPVDLHVQKSSLQLTFTAPLDEKSATDAENYSVDQWNYLWTGNYGSPDVSALDAGRKGRDSLTIAGVNLSADKKTVTIELPDVKPVMQMKIKFKIKAADGSALDKEIFSTVNAVPGS